MVAHASSVLQLAKLNPDLKIDNSVDFHGIWHNVVLLPGPHAQDRVTSRMGEGGFYRYIALECDLGQYLLSIEEWDFSTSVSSIL